MHSKFSFVEAISTYFSQCYISILFIFIDRRREEKEQNQREKKDHHLLIESNILLSPVSAVFTTTLLFFFSFLFPSLFSAFFIILQRE
jgi:hypothetical protein